MFKSKKELKRDLAESNQRMLYYRGTIVSILDILRAAEETNENVYTTIKKIKDILYREI